MSTMEQCHRQRVHGFTLVEMLIVLAVIAVLAALLLPALLRGRGTADRSVCSSNMRQLGMAVRTYMQDHDERRPPRLHSLVPTYVSDRRLLQCPADETGDYAFQFGCGDAILGPPPETSLVPTSYNYFRRSDKQWRVLEELGPKAGFIVDANHGERISQRVWCKRGKLLRLAMDGSVRWVNLPPECTGWWCFSTYDDGPGVPPDPGW